MALVGMSMAQNHWTPITGNQYNMTVKGVISIEGVVQNVTTLEIGAFCGEECRASTFPQFFPPTQEYVATVTIRSNALSGETITFRLFDHLTQQELNLDCENTVEFLNDGSIGTIGNWFQFAFVTPTIHNTTPGNWSDPTSWGGTVPSAGATVAIDVNCVIDEDVEVANLSISDGAILTLQSGNTLTVTGTLINAEATGLVIQDGAQLVNASANVKASYVKTIVSYEAKDNGGWYTIGSPMNTMPIAGSDFLTPEYDLYRLNETRIGGEWENYKDPSNTDFDTFENGRGYLYANSNTMTPTFSGTLNNADVVYGVTYTDRADGLSGFNIIGNPFPHAVYKGEGGAIDNTNLASGYYTLNNEGAWHVHTFEDAILPGQGILVKTTATANLDIAKSIVAATAESNGSKSAMGSLEIIVEGGSGVDRAIAYLGQGIGLDKMVGFTDQVPSLWIRNDNADYAIAHVGDDCEMLELCLGNRQEADFTMAVKVKGAVLGHLQLIDMVTGATVDLLQHPEYTFHATGSETVSRFRLAFKVATTVGEAVDEVPFAYVSGGDIMLFGVDEDATLEVFDMTGRMVSDKGLSTGVYVLRLVNGNAVKTQKIVVK